ncbi:MAG: SDR family NAD(P)-dependent oxidoreductase [Phenylobacterium sp.]|uniref:SDR family NAD(P)-dependent oxidoreductase n=1 Tax=Phenylobacterium sp. TaxID=1871053 RepID=UPI001A5DDB3A|nr:SDR family NAD(P)-dependent oxidoreductase [Phenylobacterium sp.]MBL8555390.1 SDR family NAD(P)-dependent oxidoreductase [Phenylobacterium sp.]
MRFDGESIAITGGAGELGGRIARRLSAAGADVTVLDRQPPTQSGLRFLACDLSTSLGADLAAEELARLPCDRLIHLAGVQYFGPAEAEPADHLVRTVNINLLAPMRLSQAVLPAMRRRGRGQIAFVGSIFGSINFAHFASYSSSKGGLRAYSQALRRELSGSGVDVTYVAPRAVRTAFNSPKVLEFAALTRMAMDDPDRVAARIVEAVGARRRDLYFGFPEALFVRLNAMAPRLVDRALAPSDRRVAALFE